MPGSAEPSASGAVTCSFLHVAVQEVHSYSAVTLHERLHVVARVSALPAPHAAQSSSSGTPEHTSEGAGSGAAPMVQVHTLRARTCTHWNQSIVTTASGVAPLAAAGMLSA